MTDNKQSREQKANTLGDIEDFLAYKSDLYSAKKGYRVRFDSHKKKARVKESATAFKTMFQSREKDQTEEVVEKSKFFKSISMIWLVLEALISVFFVIGMYLLADVLWISQLSPDVHFFARVTIVLFSLWVIWKA